MLIGEVLVGGELLDEALPGDSVLFDGVPIAIVVRDTIVCKVVDVAAECVGGVNMIDDTVPSSDDVEATLERLSVEVEVLDNPPEEAGVELGALYGFDLLGDSVRDGSVGVELEALYGFGLLSNPVKGGGSIVPMQEQAEEILAGEFPQCETKVGRPVVQVSIVCV